MYVFNDAQSTLLLLITPMVLELRFLDYGHLYFMFLYFILSVDIVGTQTLFNTGLSLRSDKIVIF